MATSSVRSFLLTITRRDPPGQLPKGLRDLNAELAKFAKAESRWLPPSAQHSLTTPSTRPPTSTPFSRKAGLGLKTVIRDAKGRGLESYSTEAMTRGYFKR